MSIQIEDNATDVLRKSMLGRGISSEMLAEKSGLPLAAIRRLRRERADAEICSRVAPALNLCPEKLKRLDADFDAGVSGSSANEPCIPESCTRHIMFCGNKILPKMTSNAYAWTDLDRGEAVLFDCGMNGEALVEFLKAREIKDVNLCLTHRHFDHADGQKALREAFPQLRIFSFYTLFGENEETPCERSFEASSMRIRAISVPGHTVDSVVFLWENTPAPFPPIAFTGDTLFLGSVGGCLPGHLEHSLSSIRKQLFEVLDPETILLPGHGPATTLRAERENNPFF